MFTDGQRKLFRELIRAEIAEALSALESGHNPDHSVSDAISSEIGVMVASYLYPMLDAKEKAPRLRVETPSQAFVRTEQWKKLRSQAIDKYGRKCMKCGSEDDVQVDHIKPKSLYPELALALDNLQILCWSCNKAKGKSDNGEDYRPPE